jgi:hypothetical protein
MAVEVFFGFNLMQEGFMYHHAEPTYVMLVTWLADDVPSTIPANASHQVGVGAFVLNSKGEVVLVECTSHLHQLNILVTWHD